MHSVSQSLQKYIVRSVLLWLVVSKIMVLGNSLDRKVNMPIQVVWIELFPLITGNLPT